MTKLALGTAQIGMPYGINNVRGRIPKAEAFEILKKAFEVGIDTIDTAPLYGDSEKILGDFARSCGCRKFKIISKLSKCKSSQAEEIFQKTLDDLGTKRIDGYLIHDFESYKNDKKIWETLSGLRKTGKVEKIGFSLYYPHELDYLMSDCPGIDIVQIPFSVFDQRFEQYLPILKAMKIEIHARSVFLQGLVFKDADTIDDYFEKAKSKIKRLNHLSHETGKSILSLCIGFVISNKFIDKVVIGIDSLEHLIELTTAGLKGVACDKDIRAMSGLRIDDEDIVIPSKWRFSEIRG